MAGFDVDGARKAGYSDEEIAQHLSKSRGFDYEGAKKSGYQPADIIQHLSTQPAAQSTAPTGAWEAIKSDLGGLLHPSAVSPYPGMDVEAKQGILEQGQADNQARIAEGQSLPQRVLNTVGQAAGINERGMADSAKRGDVSGVIGHAVSPLIPIAAAGAIRAVPNSVKGLPIRAVARTGELLANQKFAPIKPLLKMFTPADEATAVKIKMPGRDVGLSPSPEYPGAKLPAKPDAKFLKQNIATPMQEGSASFPASEVKPPTGYSPPAPKAESDIEMAMRGGVIANPEDQAIHAVKSRQAPPKLQFEDNTSQRILNNKAAKADMAPLGRPESPTLEQTKARIAELMQIPPPVEVRPTNGFTDEAAQNAAMQKLAPSMNQSGGYFEQAKDELGLPGDHPDVIQRAIELEQQAKSGRAYKGGPQSRDTTLDAMRNGTYKW